DRGRRSGEREAIDAERALQISAEAPSLHSVEQTSEYHRGMRVSRGILLALALMSGAVLLSQQPTPADPNGQGRQNPAGPAGGRGRAGGRANAIQIEAGQECPPGTTEVRPRLCQPPEFSPPSIVDYRPRSTLKVPGHPVPKAKFPAIDYHGHPLQ